MPADLSKYLSGAKADAIAKKKGISSKKRRLNDASAAPIASSGFIVDHDADWTGGSRQQEDEAEQAIVVENRSKAAFKPINPDFKPKDPSPEPLDEDEPLVVPNKLVGGLQSAAQLAEETANRKKKEDRMKRKALKEMEERRKAAEEAGEEQDETVHRDASGRARDTKREKAEAKRAERDKLQKDMEKMEWGKGLVQREDREKRKRDEEAIAAKPAARYADDEDLNESQRENMRWNDPAAQFLSNTSKKSKQPSRPAYKGPPPPPNRFNIKPGYRWDGVDRSTGFEKQFLQRGNVKKMRDAEAYKWSVEEM